MPMTLETIEAAFVEYRKTLTVVDKPANFDSFTQGYVRGWNAHEASLTEVSDASYCPFCDLEHQLHEDEQGFHHVIKGERIACTSGMGT